MFQYPSRHARHSPFLNGHFSFSRLQCDNKQLTAVPSIKNRKEEAASNCRLN